VEDLVSGLVEQDKIGAVSTSEELIAYGYKSNGIVSANAIKRCNGAAKMLSARLQADPYVKELLADYWLAKANVIEPNEELAKQEIPVDVVIHNGSMLLKDYKTNMGYVTEGKTCTAIVNFTTGKANLRMGITARSRLNVTALLKKANRKATVGADSKAETEVNIDIDNTQEDW